MRPTRGQVVPRGMAIVLGLAGSLSCRGLDRGAPDAAPASAAPSAPRAAPSAPGEGPSTHAVASALPPPSTVASSAGAPASSAAPRGACTAPFVVAPPYQDSLVDQAAASPALPVGPWAARPMSGPYASRELAAPGCTDVARVAAVAPFDEVVHCSTGDPMRPLGPDNIATHVLVVRTARGYFAHELVRERWPHGDRPDERPWVASVRRLAAADVIGDPGAEISAIAENGPPGGDKTRRVVLCGLGPTASPACADIPVAAGGPFHGAGALLYRVTVACDGTLDIAGWEGGTPMKLVHGRSLLAFP